MMKALHILATHTVVVFNSLLFGRDDGHAPVEAEMDWDQDEVLLKEVHLAGPPFEARVTAAPQFRVEERVVGKHLGHSLSIFTPLHNHR